MARLPGVSRGRADALQRAGGDQDAGARCGGPQQRREHEPAHADQEDPLASVAVAQVPGHQQQTRQRQDVAGDHPLQGLQVGVEVPADRRQRDAHHGRVDGGQGRAENGGQQHPAPTPAGEPQPVWAAGRLRHTIHRVHIPPSAAVTREHVSAAGLFRAAPGGRRTPSWDGMYRFQPPDDPAPTAQPPPGKPDRPKWRDA
jgi:hypothetical protein